jgi:hypothetical protein
VAIAREAHDRQSVLFVWFEEQRSRTNQIAK